VEHMHAESADGIGMCGASTKFDSPRAKKVVHFYSPGTSAVEPWSEYRAPNVATSDKNLTDREAIVHRSPREETHQMHLDGDSVTYIVNADVSKHPDLDEREVTPLLAAVVSPQTAEQAPQFAGACTGRKNSSEGLDRRATHPRLRSLTALLPPATML